MPRRFELAPVSAGTKKVYDAVLRRAFGTADLDSTGIATLALPPEVAQWPASQREMLYCAISRAAKERGVDGTPLLDQFPPFVHAGRKSKMKIPSDQEMNAYEHAAQQLAARGEITPAQAALAVLPLRMGFRSMELLKLPRAQVERAARYGEIVITRKGGNEQKLPTAHAKDLFQTLLAAPRAVGRPRLDQPLTHPSRRKRWEVVREILSPGVDETCYHLLHALVERVGESAALKGLRPHQLRHAFASRMMWDGASIVAVQLMMGHSNATMTALYLHADPIRNVQQYLRGEPSSRALH